MKTAIVVYWKSNNLYEVYSSLKGFLERFPTYKYDTINYSITRKKVPYENDTIILRRVQFITRKP